MIYVYYKSHFKGGKIMNKKKLGTGLVALALVGVVGIGGSLAWFTDTESRTNTFTTGNILLMVVQQALVMIMKMLCLEMYLRKK